MAQRELARDVCEVTQTGQQDLNVLVGHPTMNTVVNFVFTAGHWLVLKLQKFVA